MEHKDTKTRRMAAACRRALIVLLTLAATVLPSHGAEVWSGAKTFPTDYSGWEALPATSFADVAAGHIIRLKYTDVQAYATATLYKGDWTALSGMNGYVTLAGNHADIAVTPAMAAELRGGGCIVNGAGFTLTSVLVLAPGEVSHLRQDVPVTHDWLWAASERPAIDVNISNPTATATTADIEISLRTDHLAPYATTTKSVAVAGGASITESCELPPIEPGFYQCTVLVNDELAGTFNIGYAPEDIVSPPDAAPDFHTFWQQGKAQLSATPMDIKMTEMTAKSTARRKVWLVEVRSAADQTGDVFMRAYYAEPTAEGKHPAIIHFLGFDNGLPTPYCPGGDDMPAYAEMYVSIRGMFINNRPPYTNPYGSNYFIYGFDDKDHYFYRGAYLDAVRALDFLCTREKVARQNIFAEGSSLGATLAIAAAALGDGRMNAIAPALPSMSDFPDYFALTAWPGSEAKKMKEQLRWTDAQMYEMLSYFDAKNLATMVTCPVLMDFSLQDDECPPHINWAFFNNAASQEKQYITNPTLRHRLPDSWWGDFLAFFASHMRSEDGIENIVTTDAHPKGCYTPDGRRLSHYPTRPGLYIQDGRKVIVR